MLDVVGLRVETLVLYVLRSATAAVPPSLALVRVDESRPVLENVLILPLFMSLILKAVASVSLFPSLGQTTIVAFKCLKVESCFALVSHELTHGILVSIHGTIEVDRILPSPV